MSMKVFLVPPPELPVPAVRGGAVETLLGHLIAENERQGLLELCCASVPDPMAKARAAGWNHTKMFWVPAPENRRSGYRHWCGLQRRLGRPAPLDPWYNEVQKLIEAENPDFVISEGGDPTEFCAISAALGAQKCVLHLHAETWGTPELDQLYGGVLSLSEFVSRDFLSAGGVSPQKVRLLQNCIDLSRFRPGDAPGAAALRQKLGYTPEDFVVLFCGRIAEEKGIHKLVEAFLQIDDPHCHLLIVGSPFFALQSESEFLQKLKTNAAALGSRIRFTGYLPNEELPPYYRAADLACFPALWEEPAGLVAIEAMACGTPILATRSGGMAEYLDEAAAIQLPKDDDLPAALAHSILRLKQFPALRTQMGQAGTARARQFGTDSYYQNFCAILNAWHCPPDAAAGSAVKKEM